MTLSIKTLQCYAAETQGIKKEKALNIATINLNKKFHYHSCCLNESIETTSGSNTIIATTAPTCATTIIGLARVVVITFAAHPTKFP